MVIKYIEAESGRPDGSVWTLEQMQVKYPQHDFNAGPPTGYVLFEEPTLPPRQPLQVHLFGRMYKKPGTDIWTHDVTVREMYPHERAGYEEDLKRQFYASTGYLSWTYDAKLSRWVPPKQPGGGIPPPDGSTYAWNEAQQEWILQEI